MFRAIPEPVLEWLRTSRGLERMAFGAEPLFPNPRARNASRRWTEKCEWAAFKLAYAHPAKWTSSGPNCASESESRASTRVDGDPSGIRTRVLGVKGRRPGPG